MISRRQANLNLVVLAASTSSSIGWSQTDAEEPIFTQLMYPPFEALDAPQKFGYSPATAEQKEKSKKIILETPKGPRPIDIAENLVARFYEKDPDAISQWPAPSAWNPLVVEFFSSTSLRVNNDMVHWCAAFANWCLERSGRVSSRSASSQSFLNNKSFKKTTDPNVGDLAVFTCYDTNSGKNIGLGHVTFVREKPSNGRLKVIGGNQSKDGHSSIISATEFPIGDRPVKRHIDGKYVACTMRLNSYISIV